MYSCKKLEARLFGHLLFLIGGDASSFVKFCQEYSYISFGNAEANTQGNFYVHFQDKIVAPRDAVLMDEGSYYTTSGTYYEINKHFAFSVDFKSDILTIAIDSRSKDLLSFHIILIFVRLFSELLFLHGAAARICGKDIIFPAWGGAGKTHLLLFMLRNGYQYIADDIIVVEPSSNTVLPFQKTLNLLSYNFYDNRDLAKHLSLKKRFAFGQWLLIRRIIDSLPFSESSIIHKICAQIEKIFSGLIGCSLDARLVSSTPVVDKPAIVSGTFYLKRINSNHSFVEIGHFDKNSFVEKMKICLDREKSEGTNVFRRFPFSSEDFRNVKDELYSKEILKLQEFVSKNDIQSLQYGLKAHPEKIIQHLMNQIARSKKSKTGATVFKERAN